MKLRWIYTLAFLFTTIFVSGQQKGYYRFPAINKDLLVFCAEGDLWKYDIAKGYSSRLTSHPGMEASPVLSPDGTQVVFTAQYEGITELYLMNTAGSVPKRLTYDYDGRIKPLGWTADGKIIYSTRAHNTLPDPQLFKLDPSTLAIEPIPLAQASDAAYDAAGQLYFSRLPKQGSNNKRYKGGYIQQLWKFSGAKEAECLTCDFEGTSFDPMTYKDRVFFITDRDGNMNIWSMDQSGKSLKQHTFSKGYDIHAASISGSRIAFQKGADIYIYDIDANTEKMLDINIVSDFDQRKPRWIKNPSESISNYAISPEGNFIAIVSRGRLFVAPAKSGRWVEVNRRSGIRVKDVAFLSEKMITYISDENGEFEVFKTAADGTGSSQQLTHDSKVMMKNVAPSPDGKYIAYADRDEVLRVIDASTGAKKFENQDTEFGYSDMCWSYDSRFLSYSHGLGNQVQQINVVDISTGKTLPVTTTRLDSYSSAWSSDNKWFYYLSDRNLHTKVQSPWGSRQPEPYYTDVTNIYGFSLKDGQSFPFIANDPWTKDTSAKTPVTTDKDKKDSKPPAAAEKPINFQTKSGQLYKVPVKPGNLNSLTTTGDYLYWIDNGANGDGPSKLMALKMDADKKNEPTEIADGISNYLLSANGKKIMIFKNRAFAVGDANGQKVDVDKNKVDMANWSFQIDPVEDWKQMYADAWRMMRDYFYDRNLHKVDWPAIRKQYEPLLTRVTDRFELDDVLAQMVSELSTLHTFVYGGEKRTPPDLIDVGFLGASFEKVANGVKITHIYRSDPDYPEEAGPLNLPQINIQEGDIITGVNDVSLNNVHHISELLENKVGIPVKLNLLNHEGHAFEQVVKPVSAGQEFNLQYNEWELSRRERVDSSGNNEIGYLHLKAMGSYDMDAFVKQYYPIFDRKGLIIDVRHNNGGNIDSWILEKLIRKVWFYWQARTGQPYGNMPFAFRGHIVLLCDQFTASDGEAISEGFRRLGIGKVIGMRTWGGEVWLSSDNRLVDNGIATAAENGVFGPEGKWLIEGHGVDPDITVDNLPFETYKGKDAQLEYAIDYLKKLIEKEPVETPKVPAYPDKSFPYK